MGNGNVVWVERVVRGQEEDSKIVGCTEKSIWWRI